MRIRDALETAGLARPDADILLAAVLGRDRAWLRVHEDDTLPAGARDRWRQWVKRYRRNEPLAYICGEREFYGRPFTVDRRVLIPRPSTEGLVEMALAFLQSPTEDERTLEPGILGIARALRSETAAVSTVADIGTGSGCIAVTLALERPDLRVIATDISADALDVARENARRHGVEQRIVFRQGNLVQPLSDIAEPFVMVSNPPYVPEGKVLDPSVEYEPSVAIRGGRDGGEILARLMEDAVAHPQATGCVVECLQCQRLLVRGRC